MPEIEILNKIKEAMHLSCCAHSKLKVQNFDVFVHTNDKGHVPNPKDPDVIACGIDKGAASYHLLGAIIEFRNNNPTPKLIVNQLLKKKHR